MCMKAGSYEIEMLAGRCPLRHSTRRCICAERFPLILFNGLLAKSVSGFCSESVPGILFNGLLAKSVSGFCSESVPGILFNGLLAKSVSGFCLESVPGIGLGQTWADKSGGYDWLQLRQGARWQVTISNHKRVGAHLWH
jgi:hypothetical protein